jgi:putative glutamine amidotransferase
MRIGITDCYNEDKFKPYVDWIQSIEPGLEIETLSAPQKNAGRVAHVNGLILTGGGDVHPRYYGKQEDIRKTIGVNESRDEFEFEAIERALDAEIPIFGVCRGMQVMNVYLGGTLHTDLPSDGFEEHSSSTGPANQHPISIQPHSLLHAIARTSERAVNSHHHQAVNQPGKGLMVSARSSDGVIEAAEWVIKDGMPLLMLVQWHPERLVDNEFSKNLAAIFLREVQQTIHHKATT